MQTELLKCEAGQADLAVWQKIYQQGLSFVLDADAPKRCAKSAAIIDDAAQGEQAVYGVNTGFGTLARVRIAAEDTKTLQRNLILSHCCGVGPDMPRALVRLMMALKINSLGRGASGVRWAIIALMQDMLRLDVTPYIPMQGSVGASGDLAPLAHLAAVLIGEGEAWFEDERLHGGEALERAGLAPVVLQAKEGLGLINGTQFSTALALGAYFETQNLAKTALISGAMSTDAAMGSSAPFDAFVHEVRAHQGQVDAGRVLRTLFHGSPLRDSHMENDERVQDPYCIRCQPQVMGACLDALTYIGNTLEIEANGVSDNPVVCVERAEIISGGNFHAEPVAFVCDHMAIVLAEIGAIAQRRIALLVDPLLSYGLPAFLSPDPGLNSGFMIAEVTSAALMSENKSRTFPCSVDSTPTSANQEDHVSMAAHAARRLFDMIDNLTNILAIETLCGAQGIELRAPLQTSKKLQAAIAVVREQVAPLGQDRALSADIHAAAELVRSGVVARSVGADVFKTNVFGAKFA